MTKDYNLKINKKFSTIKNNKNNKSAQVRTSAPEQKYIFNNMQTQKTSNIDQQSFQYNEEFIKSLDNLKAYESFYTAKSSS